MPLVPVASLHDIPVGGCHALRAGGCPLLLLRPAPDRVHALENRCPHEGYPLSTGRIADGRLTCEWHNWKFRISDGACEIGGEDVRSFPVTVRGDEVLVELIEPDPAAVWAAQVASLEKAFAEADFSQAARAVERLLVAGHAPQAILGFVLRWSALRMTWGADHGIGVAADYARALEAGEGDADQLLMDAIHGLVEPNLRRPPLLLAAPAPEVSEASLRAAIEAEDLPAVEALVAAEPSPRVIPWLLHAATDHFLDYGHAPIFVLAASELLDRCGWADPAPVLAAVARGLALGTREERLPYMRAATRAYAAPFARLDALFARTASGNPVPVPVDALVSATLGDALAPAVDALTAALDGGAAPTALALVMGLCAAQRMLDFDVALEHDDDWREGWLDVTHALTHAEAMHRALVAYPSAELLRGLYHSARFSQHVGPLMVASEVGPSSAPLRAIVREHRFAEAPSAVRAARARGEPVEAQLMAEALAGHAVLPIFTAHHVKTAAAAIRLSRALRATFPERDDADLPLMAAARFLATPLRERRLHRRVKEARRFVHEGRRAPSKLGY